MRSHPSRPLVGALRAAAAVVAIGAGLLGIVPAAAAAELPAPATITAESDCAADAQTACIIGTLRDDNRNPVTGVEVTATDPSGATATATTNDDGAFTFKTDAEGDYQLSLDPAGLPDGVTVAAPSIDVKGVVFSQRKPAVFKLAGHGSGSESTDTSVSTGLLVWQSVAQGLLLGLLLALASLGLSLVYGTTGLSNFAHAEQVTLGGLLGATFAVSLGLPLWLAGIIVVAIGALTGFAQDLWIWAPLRRKGLGLGQLMVVTIGLSMAAEYLFQYVWGVSVLAVQTDSETAGGPLYLTPSAYVSMAIAIVVLIAVGLALTRTRIGRAVRAVSDNRPLAAASGIDVNRIIRLVWTVAMGLAALAGFLYAIVFGGMQWSTGVRLLLLMFGAVTLGGIGTAFGALVGSMIIGLATQLMGLILPGDLKYATALLILIVVLLVRPQGILGRKERVG